MVHSKVLPYFFLTLVGLALLSPPAGASPSPSPTATPSPSPPACSANCTYDGGTNQCVTQAQDVALKRDQVAYMESEVEIYNDLVARDNAILSVQNAALTALIEHIAANTIARNTVFFGDSKCWVLGGQTLYGGWRYVQSVATELPIWDVSPPFYGSDYGRGDWTKHYVTIYRKSTLQPSSSTHGDHKMCNNYIKEAIDNNDDNPASYHTYGEDLVGFPIWGREPTVELVNGKPTSTGPNTGGACDVANNAVKAFIQGFIDGELTRKLEIEGAVASWQNKLAQDTESLNQALDDKIIAEAELTIAGVNLISCENNAFPLSGGEIPKSCACS